MNNSIIRIDSKALEFVVLNGKKENRFSGTVQGARELVDFVVSSNFANICLSSDFNHPDEFPEFEPNSIDIACGEAE